MEIAIAFWVYFFTSCYFHAKMTDDAQRAADDREEQVREEYREKYNV